MPTTAPPIQLPVNPILANDGSMLTRRFGKEVINYYAGGRLNRFSFLRSDTAFLKKAATSPAARYIALNDLNALIVDKRLAFFAFDEVSSLIGADPFHLTEDETIKAFDSTRSSPLVVFLGILEDDGDHGHIASGEHGDIGGQPHFAIDITPKGSHSERAKSFLKDQESKGHSVDSNPRGMTLHPDAGKS